MLAHIKELKSKYILHCMSYYISKLFLAQELYVRTSQMVQLDSKSWQKVWTSVSETEDALQAMYVYNHNGPE